MKLKIAWVLVIGVLLGGCGSTPNNTSAGASKNTQAKSGITSNAIVPNTSSDSSTKNDEIHTPDKVSIQTSNKVDDEKNSIQKLASSTQSWIVDKNGFRSDFNSYEPEVTILESSNFLESLDNLQKLDADYTSLQTDYNLLVKDTANIMDVLTNHPELKQDQNVQDMILSIGKTVDDVGTINKIIKTDMDNVIEFSNKFNSGKLKEGDVFLPHVDQLKSFTSDFKTQNLKIEQCLVRIK